MASARRKLQAFRRLLKRIRAGRAAKKQWNPEVHPRYPRGSLKGGRFRSKDGGELNPPAPRFTVTTGGPTEQDMEAWRGAREQPIPPGTSPVLVDRFRDNQAMAKNIMGRARAQPANFRGIRDADGNLQAAAIVTNEPRTLYVDYFATAPWNILRNDPRSVRDAATALIVKLVKESMTDKRRNGRIELSSLIGAVSFYEGLGFAEDEASGYHVLSSEAASSFLDRMKQRGIE